LTLFALALVAGAALTCGHGSVSGQAPDADAVGRLIRRLGSDAFAERQAASEALRRADWAALRPLRRAADGDPDPEIRRRAARILDVLEERYIDARYCGYGFEIERVPGAPFELSNQTDGRGGIARVTLTRGRDRLRIEVLGETLALNGIDLGTIREDDLIRFTAAGDVSVNGDRRPRGAAPAEEDVKALTGGGTATWEKPRPGGSPLRLTCVRDGGGAVGAGVVGQAPPGIDYGAPCRFEARREDGYRFLEAWGAAFDGWYAERVLPYEIDGDVLRIGGGTASFPTGNGVQIIPLRRDWKRVKE